MNDLFENITKKLVDKLKYLSTQIQYFFDVNSLLNNTINYIENVDDEKRENESYKIQLQKQENQFEKLYELFLRSNSVIICQNEINQIIEVLQKTTNNFFEDFKGKREDIASQMNETLIQMKDTEKRYKEYVFVDDYEKRNYYDYLFETEKMKKEIEQQKQKEDDKKDEKRESDEKEMNRWKLIEEDEMKQKEKLNEEEKERKLKLLENILNEKEIEMLEKEIGRKCEDIIFDSNKDDWSLEKCKFAKKMKDNSHFVILIETMNRKKIGCFIENNLKEFDKFINDPNAFIFKISKDIITKYEIKEEQNAIKIYNDNKLMNKILFEIGNGDIVINCFEKKDTCNCTQMSYEYNDKENELLEKKNKTFEVEQFVVIQMEKTLEEQRKSLLSSYKVFVKEEEVEIIEFMCELKLKDVLFDSNYNDWSVGTSKFDQMIFGKENLIFIISDTKRNVFGGFIGSRIDEMMSYENDKWIGKQFDEKAFIFSLRSNNRLNEQELFKINPEKINKSFQLFKSDDNCLFKFGEENDICIMKKDQEDKCYCEQKSFDYGDLQNVLVGKEGEENTFTVKRIQVWQMTMTQEEIQEKEEQEKIEFENELKRLQKESVLILNKRKEEIKQLESLSKTSFDRLVFDSDLCDWDIHTTRIDKHLLGREKLVFLIEDINANLFGGFMNEKISDIHSDKDIESKEKRDITCSSFLFSLKSNRRLITSRRFFKKENIDLPFHLFGKDNEKLFYFGNSDIKVFKHFKKNKCYSQPNSYNFNGYENILTGSIGKHNTFTVKRIQVLQMKITKESEKQLQNYKDKIFEKEMIKLKEFTEELKNNKTEELKQIEQWTNMKFREIVFDSEFCDWSIDTSTFDKHIMNKSKLVFIIEDEEGNVFGEFVKNKINRIWRYDDDKWKGQQIGDKNAFVFSLKSNGRFEQPKKFMIKSQQENDVIRVIDHKNIFLFTAGYYNDLMIMKKEMKNCNYCNEYSFDYGGYKNALVGKSRRENMFEVKRIQVWQMFETDKSKTTKLQKEKEIEKQREEIYKHEIEKQLPEWGKEINKIYNKEIELFEKWTQMKCGDLLFDSECCEWKINTSTFDKHLLNKDNVIILLEDTENNLFGGFVKTTINSIRYEENGLWKNDIITDKNSFLYSIKSNGRLEQSEKFIIKNEDSHWAFQLFKAKEKLLFAFGKGNDLCVFKEDMKDQCHCKQFSFEYNGQQNVLVGKESQENPFTLKRILCWQMIETEEQKEREKIETIQNLEREKQVLIQLTEKVKKEESNEIKQIEQWTGMSFNKILYDSDYCDWKMVTTLFNKHIDGYDNCAFIIEDINGNVFGGFINKKIDLKELYNTDQIQKLLLKDKNAFVFSLNSNGRFLSPMKFPLKQEESDCAIVFFKEEEIVLFVLGAYDIIVTKEEGKTGCFNYQYSFDFGEYKKALNGKEGRDDIYTIKRVQVWHFTWSEEQKKQIKENERRKHQLRLDIIKEEKRQLTLLNENIMNEFQYEIEQIEIWTGLHSKSILFDNNYCDWSRDSSTFVEHISQKEKLAFLIVTETNVKYGGFLYSKAQPKIYFKETDSYEGVVDPKSFIFTFKDDDPMKFHLNVEIQNKSSFFLNADVNLPELFSFGSNGYQEIWVGKKGVNPFCCQNEEKTYYDFKGRKSVLTGISGDLIFENQFPIKRFIVIQFQ